MRHARFQRSACSVKANVFEIVIIDVQSFSSFSPNSQIRPYSELERPQPAMQSGDGHLLALTRVQRHRLGAKRQACVSPTQSRDPPPTRDARIRQHRIWHFESSPGISPCGLQLLGEGFNSWDLEHAELQRIISIFVLCPSLLWSNQPRHLDAPKWGLGLAGLHSR